MDKLFRFVLYLSCSVPSTANENKELSKWWQILGAELIFIDSDGKLSIYKFFYQSESAVCNTKIHYSPFFLLHSCCLFWWYNNLNIDHWLCTISFSIFALASFSLSLWIISDAWRLYVLYFLIRYFNYEVFFLIKKTFIYYNRKVWLVIGAKYIFSLL